MSAVLQDSANHTFATSGSVCKGLCMCLASQVHFNFMKLHHISFILGMQKQRNCE